jgi:hypothetical protein
MNTPPEALVPLLAELEGALTQVQLALSQRDAVLLERQASQVQRLMSEALGAARSGSLPPELRARLAQAGAQMAAQRQTLGRATAALDRAIDVLMPSEPIGLYGATGRNLRRRSTDSLTA